MPLPQDYRYAIAFVTADREDDHGRVQRKPIGTAFIVQAWSTGSQRYRFRYVVTASHVVRNVDETFIRLHRKEGRWNPEPGGVEDVRVPDWFYPSDRGDDVAAAPLSVGDDDYYYKVIPFSLDPPDPDRDRYRRDPELGETIHFLGLLGHVDDMGEANIPMLRTGALGALNQSGVPVRVAPKTTFRVDAHLIDCFSHRGFSGSPVFRQYVKFSWDWEDVRGSQVPYMKPERPTPFLGILIGHFPVKETGRLIEAGYESEFEIPVNAGVGVVLPPSKIREALNMPALVEDRRRRMEKSDNDSEPAVLDDGEEGAAEDG